MRWSIDMGCIALEVVVWVNMFIGCRMALIMGCMYAWKVDRELDAALAHLLWSSSCNARTEDLRWAHLSLLEYHLADFESDP